MSDNTNENPKKRFSLEVTRPALQDEVESAKILYQEGLFEEAKKTLYRILLIDHEHVKAKALLKLIHEKEEAQLLRASPTKSSNKVYEDPDQIADSLFADLGMAQEEPEGEAITGQWRQSEGLGERELFDLGVAFYEMNCFEDAVRELKKAERMIRLKHSVLGELGVAVVALLSECLVRAGQPFEAKGLLEPVLSEPEVKLEEKTALFYAMGLIEEELGHLIEAKGWYRQVSLLEPEYRDSRFKLKKLK